MFEEWDTLFVPGSKIADGGGEDETKRAVMRGIYLREGMVTG